MKKRCFTILIGIYGLCCILLIACGKTQTQIESAQIEQFIRLVFTSNVDGRYEVICNADMSDEDELNKVSEEYYKPFEKMVTVECLDIMKANRIPLVYDKMAMEQNAEITVSKITITKKEEGIYSFAVVLCIARDGEEFEENRTGTIQTVIVDDQFQINSFYCDKGI